MGVYAVRVFGQTEEEADQSSTDHIPPKYRDWKIISVAHEEASLNDLHTILGSDVAVITSREGMLPHPECAIIARLAWSFDPLIECNKAFGRPLRFVAFRRPLTRHFTMPSGEGGNHPIVTVPWRTTTGPSNLAG
jgi:hypothetical protein